MVGLGRLRRVEELGWRRVSRWHSESVLQILEQEGPKMEVLEAAEHQKAFILYSIIFSDFLTTCICCLLRRCWVRWNGAFGRNSEKDLDG
jgi:hypothetical protein